MKAMCTATPIFAALLGSLRGPLVGLRQFGFEQHMPDLLASTSLILVVKSSRISYQSIVCVAIFCF